MQLNLPGRYIITFLLLLLVMLELHEIVHIVVGRLICGCWGTRDFNVWNLCAGCDSNSVAWLATAAGPLFSFMLMWVGMFWLRAVHPGKRALGFSLIFANIPFGRITTVMMGGGDEMVVTRYFLKDHYSRTQMILLCSAIVLALGVPPIIMAYNAITNKRRWLYIAGFLTLPLLFLLLYVLTFLNSLLTRGFLSTPFIMGTPLFIMLHTAVAIILLVILRKNLVSLNAAAKWASMAVLN